VHQTLTPLPEELYWTPVLGITKDRLAPRLRPPAVRFFLEADLPKLVAVTTFGMGAAAGGGAGVLPPPPKHISLYPF